MKFELNNKEIETLQKTIEALDFLLDGADEIRRTFHFYQTGLGNKCSVSLVGVKNDKKTTVEKDLTDYDSW